MESNERQVVGLRLLYDLAIAAIAVHFVNVVSVILDGPWSNFEWLELLGCLSMAGMIAVWPRVPTHFRPHLMLVPFCYCATRWTLSWALGDPALVYTSTLSLALYLPFLVATALLLGTPVRRIVLASLILAVIGGLGSQRALLAPTPLEEWRIGPSFFGASLLLISYFARWRTHFTALSDARERERLLTLQLRETAEQRLVDRMDSVTRIAGALSHELNNLLAVIHPLSATLAEELEGEHARDAQDVFKTSERARLLGQQLRLLTEHRGHASSVSLSTCLQEQEASFVESYSSRNPVLFELTEDACTARIDEREWMLLVSHLVSNAVEASPPGSPVHVFLSIDTTRASSPAVLLEVRDRGTGFSDNMIDQAFEPYVTTSSTPGRGLGLTTAYAIASRFGGTITARNNDDGGATVSVSLPCTGGATTHRNVAREVAPGSARALHILLVDDEPMVLRATRRMLKRLGHTVVAFSSPIAALDALVDGSTPFDLVVSDIRMPDMSGPELLRQVQQQCQETPPFLFVTGHIDDTSAQFLGVPASHIVHKPFTPAQLDASMRHRVTAVAS